MTEHPEWVGDLRPCDFAGFVCHRRKDFVGRDWLFDEIDAWQTGGDEPVLLVKGDPGMGKSALLAELAHANPGGRILAYHFCQANRLKTLRPGPFVRSLAAVLAGRLEAYAAKLEDPSLREALGGSRCEADPASAFEKGILAPLQALSAPATGACCILVDALDEALAPQGAPVPATIVDVLESRLDRLPPWVRILATTRGEGTTLRQLRGLRARQVDLNDPRGRADVRCYISDRLDNADLAKGVAAGNLSRERVAEILEEKSGGNFLYVKQALDGLRRDQFGLEDLEALPAGLGGLYGELFDRCFPDEASFAPASRVLDVVMAATEPLSADQLAAATGMDDQAELAAVLETLSRHGAVAGLPTEPGLPAGSGDPRRAREESEEPARYALFHESLADWLTNTEHGGAVHHVCAKRGHERLADVGWNEYRAGLRAMSPYALEHLPGHLIAAERWDDLEALLTDSCYLEAKTEAGLVFALSADFTAAVNVTPADRPRRRMLHVLEEALHRDAGFISSNPTALFQCLWNSAWWHDCPESIGHYDSPAPAVAGRLTEPRLPAGSGDPRRAEGSGDPRRAEGSGDPRRAEGSGDPRRAEPPGRKLCELLQAWRAAKETETPGFPWVRSLRPPPAEAGGSKQAVLRGHERGVLAVAYCPDAKRILSGSLDETVRVWDAETGDEVFCLRGHERGVRSVAFSPDHGWIVSGSMDQTVRLWDAASGTELRCLSGHARDVTHVACSPDGPWIVSSSLDQTIRLWNGETGAEVRCFHGHESAVNAAAYSPDGRKIVSGSKDHTVRIWDADSGTQLACFAGHANDVTAVAFSPDGRRVASGAKDRSVRVWDAADGAELGCLRGHGRDVTSLAFSPDGRRIVTGSLDQTVRVWDAETGVEIRCLKGHARDVTSVDWSSDGRQLLSGSWDEAVRVWDADSAAEIRTLRGHTDWVRSLALSPDGRQLVSGSVDRTVRVWDSQSGVQLFCLAGHTRDIVTAAFSPNGRQIASGSFDNTVRLWEAQTGAEFRCLRGHRSSVYSVVYSPDGRRVASGSLDQTVRVWDAETGEEVHCLHGHDYWVLKVVYTPDGRRIVSAALDQTLRVWDAEMGDELHCLRGHEMDVTSVACSPDGRRIASGSLDQTVRIWDAQRGTELGSLSGHTRGVTGVAFSPGGERIASVSFDNTVRVWNAETAECLEVIQGQGDVAAIAREASPSVWRALARGSETVFEAPAAKGPIARFPETLEHLIAHPEGRIWAGASANHVHLITLEGPADPPDESNPALGVAEE